MEDRIIQRAQHGDHRAFQQLAENYHAVAWRTAHALLKDTAQVEDVLQEAWIDVWRGLPRFQSQRPFRPWLLTIVANRCRMALRRTMPVTLSLEQSNFDKLDDSEDLFKRIVYEEADVEMHKALATLSDDQRQALELRYFADLELNEIALVTSTPLGTIKSRIHRALNTLRSHFQQQRFHISGKEMMLYHE